MARHKQIFTTLTTGDVAWLFGAHSNTVRRWADQGRIKAYRNTPRGERRFRREDIAHLLAELGA